MELNFGIFESKKQLKEQRELFAECFPENIETPVIEEKHYNWKFHSFPSDINSYEYSVSSDNNFIGYYAAIPYVYNCFEKEYTVGMVCDVMTGVKARGKGVFTKMGAFATDQLKDQNIAFTTGYPIRKEVIPGHLKVGWEIFFELPLYIKFIKFNGVLKSKNIEFLSPLFNFAIWLLSNIKALIQSKKDKNKTLEYYNETEIEKIEGFEDFLNKWSSEIAISLKKNIEFLKWRLAAPERHYKIMIIRKNNDIVGYSICRKIIKENVPSLALLDYFILDNSKKTNSLMQKEMVQLAKSENCETILCMTNKPTAKRYSFLKNGFFKSPFKFYLIIKNLNLKEKIDKLKDSKNWHLMWIDSDDL